MNRQIIGFVIGAVFLVLIIFVFAYVLSGVSSAEIRFHNIQVMGWFVNGISTAWSKGDWADTSPRTLKDDGNYKYMIAFVPNYTAKDINDTYCNPHRDHYLKAASSFNGCIAPDALCVCLFKLPKEKSSWNWLSITLLVIYFPPSNTGLITDNNWTKWGSDLKNMINDSLNNGNGEIVECQNMLFKGYVYSNDDETKFPYLKKNGNDSKRVFAIISEYSTGFEIHKKDNYLNITEATS